jgi:LmbE family N-acetylglucosaminyl deacetylase
MRRPGSRVCWGHQHRLPRFRYGWVKINKHEDALATAPIDDVAVKIVEIIREIKPIVGITYDAGGGYGHPGHNALHNTAVEAFY